jgi:hypothetical protein
LKRNKNKKVSIDRVGNVWIVLKLKKKKSRKNQPQKKCFGQRLPTCAACSISLFTHLGAAVCNAIKVSLAMTLPSRTKLPFPINAWSFKWTSRLRIVPWDTVGMPHITESATNVPSPRVNVSNPTPEVELNSTFLPTGNNKKMPRKNNKMGCQEKI